MDLLKASEHLKLYFELWVDNEGDPMAAKMSSLCQRQGPAYNLLSPPYIQ